MSIILRGLTSGLIITQGYGGSQVIEVLTFVDASDAEEGSLALMDSLLNTVVVSDRLEPVVLVDILDLPDIEGVMVLDMLEEDLEPTDAMEGGVAVSDMMEDELDVETSDSAEDVDASDQEE